MRVLARFVMSTLIAVTLPGLVWARSEEHDRRTDTKVSKAKTAKPSAASRPRTADTKPTGQRATMKSPVPAPERVVRQPSPAATADAKPVTSQTPVVPDGAIQATATVPSSSSNQLPMTAEATVSGTTEGAPDGRHHAPVAVKVSTTVQGTTTGSSDTSQSWKTVPVEGSTTVSNR